MIPTISLDALESALRDALLNGQGAAAADLIERIYDECKSRHLLSTDGEYALCEEEHITDCPAYGDGWCHAD